MKTIHIIFNAHIDPIWLWPWQSGLGEVISTCRSACDRLDANPDIQFTRGEAWVYEQIERIDPDLFERIRTHVKAGRWQIVGGWYIQPDCNLPSHWAMEKQIGLGKAYFEDRFGIFPHIGYNVDSFGHAAALPGLMRSFGQDCYIATRPSQQEMPLPARIFRWRGYEDGPEVTMCRPHFMSHEVEMNLTNIAKALEELPEGCDHAACFVGVGDHGGGPTEQQIAWLRRHANDLDDCRIEFSSLNRFFECICPITNTLPLIVGDLQHHAIGCYSAYRAVKTAVRRVEHRLAQAETQQYSDRETRAALDKAWKYVCFHHFHDTLGGACVPSAYISVMDQLGQAANAADEALQYEIRRKINALPDSPNQQVVIQNTTGILFDDYMEYEPWVGPAWTNRWREDYILVDEKDEPINFQLLDSESVIFDRRNDTVLPRFLFRIRLQPGEIRVVQIKRSTVPFSPKSRVTVEAGRAITNNVGVRCEIDRIDWKPEGSPSSYSLPFRLDLIRDMTDTWSHNVDRFDGPVLDTSMWEDSKVIDRGPLMASIISHGNIGKSSCQAEWRVYADEPFADLTLTVHWQEQFRVLKLVLPFQSSDKRTDGVMGTSLDRANDSKERPLRDWTLLRGTDGQQLGIVCPDVYGLDASEEHVRLTLLRSPLMAHHEPASPRGSREQFSDQGVHVFRFRFFYGSNVSTDVLDRQSTLLQRPLTIADSTKGMPTVIPGSEGLLQD